MDMRVRAVMTKNVKLTSPNDNLIDAAKPMADLDASSLPVAKCERF
jgi:CBS domain-containing protein